MKGIMRWLAGLALCIAPPALAQTSAPKVETVIVNGEKTSNEIAHSFVRAYAPPNPFLGKITRWVSNKRPVCPQMVGFPASFNAFVTARIRQVAAMVGAPVDPKTDCRANVLIIVTSTPQPLLDDVRAHRSDMLGFFNSWDEADRMARMQHPIQVWYQTATEDINGGTAPDVHFNPACGDYCTFASTGLRARNGLVSELNFVTIVADANKIAGYQLGALADYFTMLALSRTDAFDACQDLPSITSLMSPQCPNGGITNAMTATDLAYLRGVYKMDAGGSLLTQQSTIAAEIAKALEDEK